MCIVFAQGNFLYSIPDAFCCAENMVLAATELGISSCIIARGEETFDSDYGHQLMPTSPAASCCWAIAKATTRKRSPANKDVLIS